MMQYINLLLVASTSCPLLPWFVSFMPYELEPKLRAAMEQEAEVSVGFKLVGFRCCIVAALSGRHHLYVSRLGICPATNRAAECVC